MYVCSYVCTYVCMYVCVCVYIYNYKCIFKGLRPIPPTPIFHTKALGGTLGGPEVGAPELGGKASTGKSTGPGALGGPLCGDGVR